MKKLLFSIAILVSLSSFAVESGIYFDEVSSNVTGIHPSGAPHLSCAVFIFSPDDASAPLQFKVRFADVNLDSSVKFFNGKQWTWGGDFTLGYSVPLVEGGVAWNVTFGNGIATAAYEDIMYSVTLSPMLDKVTKVTVLELDSSGNSVETATCSL